MEKYIANYKVFIFPDRETGNGKDGFTAYVPKLDIADSGYSVEEALGNVHSLIKFHLESLIAEKGPIPAPDSEETLVTSALIELSPARARQFQTLVAV